jgi:hypothetical protein
MAQKNSLQSSFETAQTYYFAGLIYREEFTQIVQPEDNWNRADNLRKIFMFQRVG